MSGSAGCGRGRDELLGLGDGCREGLVDDQRGARGERRQALLEVDVGGRAEHDEVEALREQFLGRSDDLGSGMIPRGLRTPAGSLVEMASSEKRGSAAMNGAWKMRPERP